MDKKGVEIILETWIYLSIIGFFLAIMLIWVGGMASGNITKAQIVSKEVALVIDSASPETTISIVHDPGKITIDSEKKEINVLFEKSGFIYDYFSQYKVSATEVNETLTTIKIEK
jgi:hypothetical protein